MDEVAKRLADEHHWLRYAARHGDRSLARQIVAAWVSYAVGRPATASKLRKAGWLEVKWNDPQAGPRASRFRFEDVVEVVVASGDVDEVALGLPPMTSKSLPSDFHYAHNIPPMMDHTGTFKVSAVGSLGAAFPVRPTLDREGMFFTSFEGVLYENVVELHNRLVMSSDGLLMRGHRWFNDLRVLVNDVVAAVDIALSYLYLLGEYAPKAGWRFDRDKLGPRHGRRMKDKLAWVHAITGQHLDATEGRAAFDELRELRNHLNHFDPPCVAYSVDDAAHWLNLMPAVGRLLWQIRRCMNEPLSRLLVRWLLLRPVVVVPVDPGRHRPAQLPRAGYASTRWPPTP
ncbi:MAG: hypothetical protein ABMA64_21425 [Myxococcota bacterium]